MRMPRVRFTVRGIMLVVAVAGVLTWGEQGRRRWAHHRARAAVWETQERAFLGFASRFDRTAGECRARGDAGEAARYAGMAAQSRAEAESLAGMRRGHERAARRSWLAIAADPPGRE